MKKGEEKEGERGIRRRWNTKRKEGKQKKKEE